MASCKSFINIRIEDNLVLVNSELFRYGMYDDWFNKHIWHDSVSDPMNANRVWVTQAEIVGQYILPFNENLINFSVDSNVLIIQKTADTLDLTDDIMKQRKSLCCGFYLRIRTPNNI
jgi:hypothetical protein